MNKRRISSSSEFNILCRNKVAYILHIVLISRRKLKLFCTKRVKFSNILAGSIILLSVAIFGHSLVLNPKCDNNVSSVSSSSNNNKASQLLHFPPCSCHQAGEEKNSSAKVRLHDNDLRGNASALIKRKLEISELIWARSVASRRAWLTGKNLSSINPWDGENYVFFWNYFPPSFNCPHSVERVGFIGDGGKWICGLELIESLPPQQPCIIYSFGVANESSFEAEMLKRTKCLVFAYDYSVKSIGFPVPSNEPRVAFKALGLGNKNLGKYRTLKFLMEQNGHEWIDIIKMDIEGGEYSALDKAMLDFDNQPLPFGQLLLEVHVEGKLFPKVYSWWERLEARGLRPFQSEVNHVACAITKVNPNYVEYSFLNVYGNHRLVT